MEVMTPHPKYPGPTVVPDLPPAYDSLPPPAPNNMPQPQACPPTAYANAPPPAAYSMPPRPACCPPTCTVPPSPMCPPPTRDGVPPPAYSPPMYEKPSLSAYHSPTQMPTLPVYPPFYSTMKNQNSYTSGQHFSWPYQLWRENSMPLLPPTYPGSPYPYYYNPYYVQTTHHVTHPQMPQYIPSPPYHMTHPQSMPKTPQYFSPTHQLNNFYAHPRYTSPYPPSMPPSRPSSFNNRSYGFQSKSFKLKSQTSQCRENRSGEASDTSSSEDENVEQESNVSQELNEENSSDNISDKESGSISLKDPESEGKDKGVPRDNGDEKGPNEIRNCSIQNHGTASGNPSNVNNNENICDKASESNSLKDAKSGEEDENIEKQIKDSKGQGESNNCAVKNHSTASEPPSEDSSSDTVNAEASESSSLRAAEIEKKGESISQETEDTEGPNKVKNCSEKNNSSTALESSLKSDCTKSTSRRKKKKKQKNICDAKDEGSPVSDVSHKLENEKEHHKLKDVKNFLTQHKGVITEVHSTMGKLQTPSGTEYYFTPALCFLYGVSLTHLELWHVLIEGQQVDVTLDMTNQKMPKVTQVTVKDKNPDHDRDATILDLQQWCSTNCVPEKATATLIQQMRGLQ